MKNGINAMETKYEILQHLKDLQPTSNGWQACCPAHDDKKASLSIGVGKDNCLLLHCHAGCETVNILRRLSLSMSALFPKPGKYQQNGKPKASIVATYDYCDADGVLLYQACRMKPKDFRQRRPDGKGGWTWKTKGIKKVLYNLPKIKSDTNGTIYIVEGEKDASRLSDAGYTATCNVGGAGKWLKSYSQSLKGRNVVILPDNDEPGQQHAKQTAQSLVGVAASIKIIELPGLPAKGDFSDWIQIEGNTKARFNEIVTAAPLYESGGPENRSEQINVANEADDDPHRLARIFMGEKTSLRSYRDDCIIHNGKHYETIRSNTIRLMISQSVKREFDRLNLEKLNAPQFGDSKPVAKKVTRALTSNILQALQSEIFISDSLEPPCWIDPKGQQINHHTNYIALQNGIVSVDDVITLWPPEEANKSPLQPHSSDWFSFHCLPYEYNPEAECPKWLQIVNLVLEEDQERIDLLQEWFGYLLLPDTSRQKFMILHGEGGTGKSTVCGVIEALLGDVNVSSVPLEMFGERFALYGTLNKLANIVPESNEYNRVAENYLKQFTSGEKMAFEQKGKDTIFRKPTARMILGANELPPFADKTSGLWRRMILMPFRVILKNIPGYKTEYGIDKSEWWINSGEMPGVFNWALEGLRRLRMKNDFTFSTVCDNAHALTRLNQNPASEFLVDNYRESQYGYLTTGDIYKAYRNWCDENGHLRPMASNKFGSEIKRVFPKSIRVQKKGFDGKREWGYEGICEGIEIK